MKVRLELTLLSWKLHCFSYVLFVRRYDEDHLHILWRGEGKDNDDDKGDDDDANFGGRRWACVADAM